MSGKLAGVVVCLLAGAAVALLCLPHAEAQAMPLGQVSGVTNTACPLLQKGFDLNSSTQCFTAQVINCPNADNLSFAYAVTPPAQGTQLLGTIVLLTGDGGTYASTQAFAMYYWPYYLSIGYQVVEVAWGSGAQRNGTAWEIANSNPDGSNNANILNAACRPATFLSYVRNGGTIWSAGTGMCVHANSGGAGAAAYTLT
jgi:hypothetical protein